MPVRRLEILGSLRGFFPPACSFLNYFHSRVQAKHTLFSKLCLFYKYLLYYNILSTRSVRASIINSALFVVICLESSYVIVDVQNSPTPALHGV